MEMQPAVISFLRVWSLEWAALTRESVAVGPTQTVQHLRQPFCCGDVIRAMCCIGLEFSTLLLLNVPCFETHFF
jgi:hypothetical protein